MSETIRKDDPIVVEPKNPFTSTAVWGLIVVVLNLLIQKGAQRGYFPDSMRDIINNAATETLLYLIGFGLTLYGRWRATRPLGFGGTVRTTAKMILLMLVPLFLLGCSCPEKAVLREGMYQNVKTIRDFAKSTAANLVVDPATGKDNRDKIKSLTPFQYEEMLKTDQQFEELYQGDKSHG